MGAVDYFLGKADELLVPVVAGILIVSFAAWAFGKVYNSHVFRLKMWERNRESHPDASGLRWQAYERIVLFVERIRPHGMLVRLHQPGMDAVTLEQLLIASIREEYQHNVTQQLYVRQESWALVVQLKETTSLLIRQSAAVLPPGASGKDLSTEVLQRIAELDENPYDIALHLLRNHANG